MSSNAFKLCGLFMAAVLLAACTPSGDTGGDSQSGQVPAMPTVPQPAQPKPQTNEMIVFELSPATMSGCEGVPPGKTKVSWFVKDTKVQEIKVEVAGAGKETWKLLTVAGRKGEVETGSWVLKGTRFQLIDNMTGEQLAFVEMGSEPCN